MLFRAGQWLILEACKQLRDWKAEITTMGAFTVSVNISGKQMANSRFVDDLEAILRQTGIDSAQLHVELTENVAATDPELTTTVLAHLKRLRVGVVLDDFGSGNSFLSGLRQFPLEALKIDRSLVAAMLLDRGACDTVELILLLAHKLKFKVIAEGIESLKQLDRLHALGCELGQGSLLSQPVEPKAAELLLQASSSMPQARVAGAQ